MNQRAVINKESGVVRITNIDVSNSVAWTSNILYFDMEPLGDIAARLTRIYGVEIEFKSEAAKDLLFYGRFRSDKQSIKSVLSSFANTGKISYEFDGERVVIE